MVICYKDPEILPRQSELRDLETDLTISSLDRKIYRPAASCKALHLLLFLGNLSLLLELTWFTC